MGDSILILSACAVTLVIVLLLIAQLKRKDTMSELVNKVLPKNYCRHVKK